MQAEGSVAISNPSGEQQLIRRVDAVKICCLTTHVGVVALHQPAVRSLDGLA
jgi:hypothetical protein